MTLKEKKQFHCGTNFRNTTVLNTLYDTIIVFLANVYVFKLGRFFQFQMDSIFMATVKVDKTKLFIKIGSLTRVGSIAECFTWSILQCIKR